MASNAAVVVGVTVAVLILRRRARADFRSEIRNISESVARRVHDEIGSKKKGSKMTRAEIIGACGLSLVPVDDRIFYLS